MLLYFIRHGDPIYNPDSLTPQGKLQAAALANRLAQAGISRIYTSSSNRAQMTAAPTAERLGLEPVVLDWARESRNGEYFYLHNPEGGNSCWCFQFPRIIRQFNSPAVRALGAEWYRAPEFADYPFAEGCALFQTYTDDFLASLGYVHDRKTCTYRIERPNEERIAFFAHQGFGMIFLSSLLDIPYPLFSTHFDFGHSSMTVIELKPLAADDSICVPRVLQLSNDSHLYRDGLPTKYQNRVEI